MQNMKTLDDEEEDEEDNIEGDEDDGEENEEPDQFEIDEEGEDEEDDAEDDDDDNDQEEDDDSEDADSDSAPSQTRRGGASTTDEDENTPESSTLSAAGIRQANKGRGPKIEFEGELDDSMEADSPVGNLAEGSDSSADEGEDGLAVKYRNRIGNVPLEWYNDYDHIGYDVTGKKIIKSAKGDKLDQLLARMDDPNWE